MAIKTEYLDNYYTSESHSARPAPVHTPWPAAELKPGMYVNHVASPSIAATIIAVNQGFALVEMMDGSGTRQCAVSELSAIATMTTAAAPAASMAATTHHSNLNSINADPPTPYQQHHHQWHGDMTTQADPTYALAQATAGLELLASTSTYPLDSHLFTMDQALDADMDVSLGYGATTTVSSFFDEQYA